MSFLPRERLPSGHVVAAGLNFINVLQAAFAGAYPESTKIESSRQSGSACAKAAYVGFVFFLAKEYLRKNAKGAGKIMIKWATWTISSSFYLSFLYKSFSKHLFNYS